jgi:hypothetical protein
MAIDKVIASIHLCCSVDRFNGPRKFKCPRSSRYTFFGFPCEALGLAQQCYT